MIRSIHISKLAQHNIRNLVSADVQFSPQLNIVCGDNGQGKTSLLEAIALASTGRSFRTEQARDLIRHGAGAAASLIEVNEAGVLRKQRVELAKGRKLTSVDESRVPRTQDFAVLTPIVVFHPADLDLIGGPAALRRTLLARVSLYLEPYHFESYKAYQLALRERQRLLVDHGMHAPGLDAFEKVAADHGAIVTQANARAAQQLIAALAPILIELAPRSLCVQVSHIANGSADPGEFSEQLKRSRVRDQARGRPLFGPQRDELQVLLDGADARRHASQGQQRLLALTLKLAELASIRDVRHVFPVLLLDDVASELDSHRTGALLDWLLNCQSQVFITTAHWDVAETRINSATLCQFLNIRGGVAEQITPSFKRL
ncbi:MAG TPA: DNA replication and repair protein RecF [Polyangiaceae bacterium]|nr:DNA replication and repair protein RecF [Polyangiaceae bacterium]